MSPFLIKTIITKNTIINKLYLTSVMSHQLLVRVMLPFCSTRGYYQLEFNCSLNNKPIPGPSVNFTVLPDPNKPVSLAVEYNTLARFPAGGTFPGLHLYPFFLRTTGFSLCLSKLKAAVCLSSVLCDCGV